MHFFSHPTQINLLGPRERRPGVVDRREQTVLKMHLHARPIRCFTQPYVEILTFSRFEEEDVIAVVEVRNLVQVVEF